MLKAQINKTDRNDARGIAQMMRVGLYRPVHVKTLRSQKLRMLLIHRKLLQSKAIAIENDFARHITQLRPQDRHSGGTKFEARIKELVGPIQGPMCRFRREARARERHRHCIDGKPKSA